MKVGLVLPPSSGDASRPLAFARAAEELGFDGVFATDHMFRFGDPSGPSLEPFAALAAIAAAGGRLHLGTLVARVGLREPAMLAKMAASVDDLSGGRFILGLGTGDDGNRPEHEVFGIPWESSIVERRGLLRETAGAVKSLLATEPWPGGDHTPAIPGRLRPAPAREGGPPVWIGGNADELVEMAGEIADGWNSWNMRADRFARKAALLRGSSEATWGGVVLVGRDDADVIARKQARRAKSLPEVWSGTPHQLADLAGELAAGGATWCVFAPVSGEGVVELIAAHILPAVHA